MEALQTSRVVKVKDILNVNKIFSILQRKKNIEPYEK